MILYGSSLSPFVRKVLAFATEKEIELELRASGVPAPTPEFRAASPFGKMPALVDGEFALADSSAIVHYLEAKFPGRPLIPADPQERGRTIWYDEFADTMLTASGSKIFFNRLVAPVFLKMEGDLALAEKVQREELPPVLDYLESIAPEPGEFLVGGRLTLADISVASPFGSFRHLEDVFDDRRYGRTLAYVDSILSRPSFAPWIVKETAMLRAMVNFDS